MKITIEKITCDDCGKEVKSDHYMTFGLEYFKKDGIKYFIDLCFQCINERLSHSFSICEDRRCKECNGKGQVKDFPSCGSDFNWEKCEKCKGEGVLLL
jgi:hypothetical protein